MDAPPPAIERVAATVAESVGPHLDAERLRRQLLTAGLLRDIDPVDDAEAPQSWLAAIRGLVFTLAEAEARASAARRAPRWIRFSAPPYWWIGLPALGGLGLLLALVLGDTFEERMRIVGWEAQVLLLAALGVLAWTVVENVRERRAVAADRGAAESTRESARAELLAGVVGLLGRSFLARIGPHRWLLHTPHLDWVEARLRDVHGVASAAPPDLVADLEAARAALSAACAAAEAAPPEVWTPLDAGVDVGGLAGRWDAAGLRRAADEAGRWRALGA
jgi:hypothetical protein